MIPESLCKIKEAGLPVDFYKRLEKPSLFENLPDLLNHLENPMMKYELGVALDKLGIKYGIWVI